MMNELRTIFERNEQAGACFDYETKVYWGEV